MPPAAMSEIGTWIAMLCTFTAAVEFTPVAWLESRAVRRWRAGSRSDAGRRGRRSNPRSTKNASARWPAKTLRPPPHRVDGRDSRGSRSSASTAVRCCTAGTARSLASTCASCRCRHSRHRVELATVPVLARQRLDRPDVVEERGRNRVLAVELELVGDVGDAVAVVVDVDLVEDVVAELIEVRSRRRVTAAGCSWR